MEPSPLRQEIIYRLRRIYWWLNPTAWINQLRLTNYKDRHSGERCFIIGNGPSLNDTDLNHLEGEICFSMNRGYLLFDRIGEPTKYYLSVNRTVIRQWPDEIASLPCEKFIPWGTRHWLPQRSDIVLLGGPVKDEPPRFSRDIRFDFWGGSTVTYVAMQLAFYMGFEKVYLVGVDHRFTAQGDPHQLVVAEGPDQNHFSPDYFGTGVEWNLPDLKSSELAYMLARLYYQRAGRKIIDATVNGALDIFPKVDFASLFG